MAQWLQERWFRRGDVAIRMLAIDDGHAFAPTTAHSKVADVMFMAVRLGAGPDSTRAALEMRDEVRAEWIGRFASEWNSLDAEVDI